MKPIKTKTKAELLEELDELKVELANKEKEIKDLERYKKYEEAADEMKAMHDAMMNSGFTNEQAFQMLMVMIPAAANMAKSKFII